MLLHSRITMTTSEWASNRGLNADGVWPAFSCVDEEQLAILLEVQIVAVCLAATVVVGQHELMVDVVEQPDALRMAAFGLPCFTFRGRVVGKAQLPVEDDRHARTCRPFFRLVERDHMNNAASLWLPLHPS